MLRALKVLQRAQRIANASKNVSKGSKGLKGLANLNPLELGTAPIRALGSALVSKPAQALYVASAPVGAATAVAVNLDANNNPNSQFGVSQRATGELKEWDTESGGLKAPDLGDRLLDIVTGTDRTKLEDATRKKRNAEFNKTYADDLLRLQQGLKDEFKLGSGVKINENGELVLSDTLTSQQGGKRINSELDRLNVYEDLKGKGVTGLSGSQTISQMNATAEAWRKEQPTSLEQQLIRAEQDRLRQYEQTRLDRLYQDKMADYRFQLENTRYEHQREEAHKDRQQTLQFKLMDRQDARLDRADRVAREDRADKRAAISSMVKGLSQLGYAFAL